MVAGREGSAASAAAPARAARPKVRPDARAGQGRPARPPAGRPCRGPDGATRSAGPRPPPVFARPLPIRPRCPWRSRAAAHAVAALLALVAGACTTDVTGLAGTGVNTPAVGLTPGQFGFAVTARAWTADQRYSPDLGLGPVQVGLTVSGYAGGRGQVTITDAGEATVFEADLAGNVAQGSNATVRGRAPFRVRVAASGYTGTVALGVTAAPAGP